MRRFPSLLAAAALLSLGLAAQTLSPSLFAGMRWRSIGPYRGGRTRAASGVAGQPNVFYIGAVDGGVWKSTDYGRTWQPIFDSEPTGSIGALAVAPSDPNVIYVGSGEGLHRPDLSVGDGMYKSTDAGRTWTHLGLRNGQQIAKIAVDPRDANRLFAAVLGHPYGPNPERGIYRSTDGGQTFERVLYKNEYTGGSDVAVDPADPSIVYAALWQAQEGPWENGEFGGADGGLFKSTDGGATWQPLTDGLPAGVDQVNIAIAPSEPARLYASVAYGERKVGLFRSDDGGASWRRITDDPRPNARIGGGDLPVPVVDPRNPDVVYVCTPVLWKSSDGGKTWMGLRGAPGGDDYQSVWINPNDPAIMLVGSDQGAIITENGGRTWSSWYNQPTAQVYHVATDNAFPYRVCSGQQDSGSVCISSRGNWGEITERDWLPVGAEEYAAIAPDPLDPNIVFGGKLSRFDRRTGQTAEVSPQPLRSSAFRALRTAPLIFSPLDPHLLYFAGNTLWVTGDAGDHWRQISPDLTRKTWQDPPNLGEYAATPAARPTDRGVIYAVAPSPLQRGLIWAGTDDGLIWLTRDGGQHWSNVTPPQLTAWAKVSILDAGHFDANTAYAAINTFRLDDLRPHIYRTHDGGKTWTEIVNGIPDGAAINVVREDPKHKGLLFAGSENQVYVSFDDGDHWQSLRLNMPATSIRDLQIKGADLIAGTHGRGFWILDDITPLRQAAAAAAAGRPYLYRPATAYRVRWDVNTDTPLPPDVPAGQNPPDGAILDYYLPAPASGPVALAVYAPDGKLVRRYSSEQAAPAVNPRLDIPTYWVAPPRRLSTAAGEHRFVWDLHETPAPGFPANYPMQAVVHETQPAPTSPWVLPGSYTVKLTVDGHTYSQPLVVRMDPRVRTPLAGLAAQYRLSEQMYRAVVASGQALEQLNALRRQIRERQSSASGAAAAALAAFDRQAQALAGGGSNSRFFMFFAAAAGPPTIAATRIRCFALMNLLQGADVAPTSQAAAAVQREQASWNKLAARWRTLRTQDLAQLNASLKAAGLDPIALANAGQ
ncbi:MAG TPA: glycoside hydrolase [Terriglobales bacterium]|nr:glycoside hydrolase [Terriglobales bacterium]